MGDWDPVYFKLLEILGSDQPNVGGVLFDLLRKQEQNFIDQLEVRPPNKNDRDKVNKKEAIKPTEQYKRIADKPEVITKLSDSLKLNEIETVELLSRAEAIGPCENLSSVAAELHYSNRTYMLYTLLTIFNYAMDHRHSAVIRNPLGNFVRSLLDKGLVEKIIKAIDANMSNKDPERRVSILAEQSQLSVILFTIFYSLSTKVKDLRLVVALIQKGSEALAPERKNLETAKLVTNPDYALLCSLTMSFLAAIQLNEEGVEMDTQQFAKLEQDLQTLLLDNNKWGMTDFSSIMMFGWGMYVTVFNESNASALVKTSIEKGAFEYFTLMTETFATFAKSSAADNPLPTTIAVYYQHLADLLDAFIRSEAPLIRDLKLAFEATQEETMLGEKSENPEAFKSLLRYVTCLYKYHENGNEFWKDNSLKDFVRTTESQFCHSEYIDMLASLGSSPESSYSLFISLKDTHSAEISWNSFFSWINNFLSSFNNQSPDGTITEHDRTILTSILHVTRSAAKHDDRARNALYSNRTWKPLEYLFNLLACPIPLPLKAEALSTIQAFAHSHDLVSLIWHHIDALVSSQDGIRRELINIESKHQEYPYLLAFLDTLQYLVNVKIPDDLGLGNKNTGISAHLKFIIEDVILRFPHRSYKIPADKWTIGSKAFSIVLTLLTNYNPSQNDFEKQYMNPKEKKNAMAKLPGFELMRRLLDHSDPLLKAIVTTIIQAESVLSQAEYDPYHIRAIENCLQILRCLLEKQNQFIEFSRKSSSPIPNLFPFQQNRQLSEFIASLPFFLLRSNNRGNNTIKLLVVNIFYLISQYERMQVSMTNTIYQNMARRKQFIEGIIECLEVPKVEDSFPELALDADTSIRMATLRLLLSSLAYPPPKNLAFLSLGYDINRSLEDGNKDTARNPLHSILDILSTNIEPELAEQCYKLIYKLCKIDVSILRRVKSNKTDLLASKIPQLYPMKFDSYAPQFNWRAWFLRIVSLDIFLASKQISSHTKQHIEALFTVRNEPKHNGDDDEDIVSENRMIMRALLDFLDYPIATPPQISPFVQGVNALLEAANLGKGDCTSVNEYDLLDFDIKGVFQKLTDAEKVLQNRGGNYDKAKEEILKSVTAKKLFVTDTTAGCEFLNAWRQTVFATLEQFHVLSESLRESILYELLEGLLLKLKLDLHAPALQIISSSILLLMQKLNEQKVGYVSQDQGNNRLSKGIENKDLPVDRLTEIFRGINEGIIRCGSVIGIVRSNLYLAFIEYIQYTKRPSFHQDPDSKITLDQEAKITSIHNQWTRLEQENARILDSTGLQLLQIVSKDADSGVHLNRTSAFALLDLLMRYDRNHHYLNFLDRQGYIQSYIADFGRQDFLLQELIKPGPKVTTELLAYSAKMSFFVSIAESGSAESLIENKLIENLHDCGFVDEMPDLTVGNEEGVTMYHQIITPVLQVLVAIINALPNSPAATHLINVFIYNHFELFSMTIRENIGTLEGLKKLELVTRIFWLTLRSSVERNVKMEKLNAVLVNLLSKYSAETGMPQIHPFSELEKQANQQPAVLFTKKTVFSELVRKESRQVVRNLALVCRYLCCNMKISSFSVAKCPTLFSSALAANVTDESNLPPIYELIKLVKTTLLNVDSAMEELRALSKKISQIKELPNNQLLELIPQPSENLEHYDKSDKHRLAFVTLSELQGERSKALRDYTIIIDATLLLLWIHLAKFLSRQDRPQESLLVTKGKPIVQVSLDGKFKKSFRQKATDLLITHPNNMLDKIEALPICGSDSNVQFITRKIRELLKAQGDS
jgi:hypothetical protein